MLTQVSMSKCCYLNYQQFTSTRLLVSTNVPEQCTMIDSVHVVVSEYSCQNLHLLRQTYRETSEQLCWRRDKDFHSISSNGSVNKKVWLTGPVLLLLVRLPLLILPLIAPLNSALINRRVTKVLFHFATLLATAVTLSLSQERTFHMNIHSCNYSFTMIHRKNKVKPFISRASSPLSLSSCELWPAIDRFFLLLESFYLFKSNIDHIHMQTFDRQLDKWQEMLMHFQHFFFFSSLASTFILFTREIECEVF